MPIQPTAKIWHNGNLIPWEKAQIHVMSHVIHYGSSVFEGIRCYAQPEGAAVFPAAGAHAAHAGFGAHLSHDAAVVARPAVLGGGGDRWRRTAWRRATSGPSRCAATARSASTPRGRRSRCTSPIFRGASISPAMRRGRVHFKLEPACAEYHAGDGQGRGQLHELAVD